MADLKRARNELLAMVNQADAADALEEMDADDPHALLGEAPTAQAAGLLSAIEPDEAIDALRDLADDERRRLLATMDGDHAD